MDDEFLAKMKRKRMEIDLQQNPYSPSYSDYVEQNAIDEIKKVNASSLTIFYNDGNKMKYDFEIEDNRLFVFDKYKERWAFIFMLRVHEGIKKISYNKFRKSKIIFDFEGVNKMIRDIQNHKGMYLKIYFNEPCWYFSNRINGERKGKTEIVFKRISIYENGATVYTSENRRGKYEDLELLNIEYGIKKYEFING